MTFGKYFTQWTVVTVVFGALSFLCNMMASARTLWPFGLSFLYIGVLILLTGNMIIEGMNKS